MAAINVSVGGDTRQLEREIQKTVNKSYNINLKTKGDQPLGRITGQVNEFEKSLAASNARVIAFGASAGIIFGLEKAFGALAASTVEVQKSLAEINVILNVSTSQLNKFGSELFNIAKDTGQSFGEVAKAATEFSRQGLGVEETLKRTNQALILSRLSGLDAAKSVESLTAAVNSYASQAVTASEVVNKFANVDAAFAVSSADLADALSRVGSSAAQSGVSLNELIAIVTAAQQTTARGGAVIGNSFKTIFTRLQRGKVVDLLENLGIDTMDSSGQIKSTIQLLQDLAKTYDQLGTLQQADVAEKVGGVFQINILKAALADLGKEYSIYNSALNVAASTTDQAIRRNEELNQTYAAQINILKENAKQLAANAGGRVLGPAFERVVGGANQVLGGINESEGGSYGSVLGKGILDGLGQIIAGPGLALLGGIFAKLFADLSKYAVGSAKDFLGLNNAAKQQAELQRSITDILSKNPALIAQMSQGTAGVNKLAETLLTTLRAQTVELQKQQQVAAQVASILSRGGVKVKDGVPMAPPTGKPGKAAGYVPNFAAGVSKKDALAETIGAYQAGYEPGGIRKKRLYDGQGGSFLATVNNAESFKTVVGPNDEKGTFVTPPNAAKGFVPNFNVSKSNIGKYIPFADSLGLKVGQVTSTDYGLVKAAVLKNGGNRSQQEIEDDIRQLAASRKGIVTTSGALRGSGKFGYLYASQGPQDEERGKIILTKGAKPVPFDFTTMGTKNPFTFQDDINNRLTPIITDLANQVLPKGSQIVPVTGEDFNQFIDKSAFSQIYGRLFEAVVNRALSKAVKGESGNQRFEFFASELAGPNGVKLQDIFDGNVGGFAAADLKFRKSPDSVLSFVKKMASATGIPYDKTAKLAAQGYVPNFSALQDAVNRERAAGVSSGKIYVAQDKRLAASGYNPLGLGVFNTRDEPNSGARSRAIKSRGYSGGFVPNFVEEDTAPADLSASVAALVTQLGFVAFALSGFGNQFKQSLNDLTKTNVEAAKANLRAARDSGLASEETRRQLSQNVRNAQKTTFGQKLGAGVTAGGSALAIGAPILAQTIANAIGQQTKETRVGSAAASAFGDIGSFAGTGALVAGPKGAIVGGLIGALTGLTGVIKELNTNLPELSSKAQQSASELTQFTEASQRTKTSFEQLQDLQSKGQNIEAGKAEQELIKNIGKDFTSNPELQAQAISAVINKDFAGLQVALDKNTIALQTKTESDNNRESIQKYFEKTRDEIGYTDVEMGISSDKIYTNKDRKQIDTEFRNSLGSKIASTGNLEENRKFVNQLDTFFKKNMAPTGPRGGRYDPEKLRNLSGQSRTDLLNLLEIPKDQQEQFQKLSQGDFYEQVTRPALGETKTKSDLFTSIDRNSGKFDKEVQALLQNIGDVRGKFDNFAQSVGFSLTLQKDFNNALAAAKTAVEAAKLGNFADAASQLGDTSAARGYNAQASVLENERQRNESMNNAFSQIQGVLTQYLVEQAKKTQESTRTTADPSAKEDPLKVAQKAQVEIRASIEKLIQQLSGINFKPGESDIDPFKSIEENLKRVFEKANVPKEQQAELAQKLTPELQNLVREAVLGNTLLKQLNTVMAEQQVGEIMKEFIAASQTAVGGRERFANTNLTFLNPFYQAIGDLINLNKGTQGRDVDIEKGRASLGLLDQVSTIVGRNIIPEIGNDNPLRQQAVEGLSLDIFNQLNSVFEEFKKLPQEQLGGLPTTILKTFGQQVGLKEEEVTAQIESGNIETLIDTIADKLAAIQVGGKVDDQVLQPLRDSAIEELLKDPKISEETATALREGFGKNLSAETLAVTELGKHTDLLTDIRDALQDPVSGQKKSGENGSESGDTPSKGSSTQSSPDAGGKNKKSSKENSSETSGNGSSGGSSGGGSGNGNYSANGAPRKESVPISPPVDPEAIKPIVFDIFKDEEDFQNFGKGYMPAYAKELNSIRKGVGGAKGSDYPLFVPNLNGDGAWINSGEKLIPNFANTGETAILTRKMQKAVNMAKGYVPNEKELQEALLRAAGINSLVQKNLGLGFDKPLGMAGEIPGVELFDPNDPKNKDFRAFTEIYGRSAKVSFKRGESIGIGTIANEATALTQNELPAGITYNPTKMDENIRQMREMGRVVGILGERGSIGDKDTKEKAAKAYRERLKEYADKIIALNENANTPFAKTKTVNLTGMEDFDQRVFGVNDPNRGFITSEFVRSNSRDYSIERLSTLNAMLFEGLQKRAIKKEDLITQGLAKDQNEADYIIKEIEKISSLIGGPKPVKPSISVSGGQTPAKPSISITSSVPDTANINSTLPGGKDFASTIIDTYRTANNNNLINTDPAKIIDQYIKNPGKLMLDNPETFDLIDKSVRGYLENPTKKPTDALSKEIQKAFNAKNPKSMNKWIDSLGLGNDGRAISRSGQVLTIGYVNGSKQKPLGYREAAMAAGAGFQADGRLVFPGRDMAREINYVKPDGTILSYKRVREKGRSDMPLRLVSATRPPNQEYITEGTSNDVIGVKEGNRTKYYSTADAELGGLGRYKGEKVIDAKGNATIYSDTGKKVGSSRSLANEPEVAEAIKRGGSISDIEKATRIARDRIRFEQTGQKIIGGENNQPAMQVNSKGQGDYVPKADPVKKVPPPPPKKEVYIEDLEKEEIKTKANGYIPSFTKEMQDIRKGIGGAIPTDTPLFIPNLNGEPAVINSGEKLIPNFAGTGETAVLTREMQKMMTVAQGYIPKKAQKYSGMGLINSIKARHGMDDEDRFSNGFVPNFYELGKTYSSRAKLLQSKQSDSPMFRTYSSRTKLFESSIEKPSLWKRLNERSDIRNRERGRSGPERSRGSRKLRSASIDKEANSFDDQSVMSQVDLSKFKNWSKKDMEFFEDLGFSYYGGPKLAKNEFPVYVPYKEGEENYNKERFNFREWMFKSGSPAGKIAQRSLPNYPIRRSNNYDNGPKASQSMFFGPWDDSSLPMSTRMMIWNNRKYSNQRTANLGYNEGPNKPPAKFDQWYQRAYDAAALAMTQSPMSNGYVGSPGPASTMPSRLNYTMPDGRTFNYTRQNIPGQTRRDLRLSSVTRPQNEQYVTEGTSNDTIASRKGNVTEYYGSQGAMLGGLGNYLGRKYSDYGPAAKTFIEDAKGAVVASSQSLSYTPEVQKVIQAGGSVRDIEMATTAARDRMSPRADRLSKMDPAQRDIMTKYYFEEDLAKKLPNGINFVSPMYELTEKESQQEILYTQGRGKRPAIISQKSREAENMRMEYLKKSAESVGMGDRFETEYLAAQERQILRAEQRKPIDQARASINRTDRFIQETDAYLMKNSPSEQYLKDRESFIIPKPVPLEDEDKNRYAKGYVPNFAIDPTAISAAKLREKREAGSDSIPTFTMYNNKPMVYDAKTQTPASAIRDHAFEGGYEGVVKRQFGSNASKNIVANMAYKMPKDGMAKTNSANNSGPVFNINFSPQTTYSSQRNGDIPNFANITKKYDTMIADMRTSLKTVWDKYGSLDNITKSNIRDGKLNSGTPRTKRTLQSINII